MGYNDPTGLQILVYCLINLRPAQTEYFALFYLHFYFPFQILVSLIIFVPKHVLCSLLFVKSNFYKTYRIAKGAVKKVP